MRFSIPEKLDDLAAYLPQFINLCGNRAWEKRTEQLATDANTSPFLAKIVADHHWLEMELASQASVLKQQGSLQAEEIIPESMAALFFAGMVVELEARLTAKGRKNLNGRIRDGLKAGFPGLYLELDVGLALLDQGYDIEFPDIEESGQFDICFSNQEIVGEVECKSLSADAGRKIHRRDFYRFMNSLHDPLRHSAAGSKNQLLVITLEDRLPSKKPKLAPLSEAAYRLVEEGKEGRTTGSYFSAELMSFESCFPNADLSDAADFYSACRKAFGEDCHVSGGFSETGGTLVVVRSRREDDHSKPQLEALKKAASQLSGRHPGIIALQYEDIKAPDLALSHVRRRAALLANAVFHSERGSHIPAVIHSAFGGLHHHEGNWVRPAFGVWNQRWSGRSDKLPFRRGIKTSEFACHLGVAPEMTDPDDYLYGVTI